MCLTSAFGVSEFSAVLLFQHCRLTKGKLTPQLKWSNVELACATWLYRTATEGSEVESSARHSTVPIFESPIALSGAEAKEGDESTSLDALAFPIRPS